MKTVAILTGPDTHLDHLGVLSSLLEIPLVVTEEKNLTFAQTFYPDLKAELKTLDTLSIDYLAKNYDAILETGKFFSAELKPFMELLFRKKMRFVFCPHGNSDKGHSLQDHVDQDISLVYGDHLHALLKQNGAAEKIGHIVRTGNYRYPYYLKHKTFFDALAQERVFSHFKRDRKTLLYAPTWSDQENPSSFFSATGRLIEDLTSSYNLLIKLHPFLMEYHPGHTLATMARYEDHPGALFLTDFPPIYPLLARCDLYVGDYSSIGYDFLAFDKPLYFLTPKKGASPSALQSCGIAIPEGYAGSLIDLLDRTLEESLERFSEVRKKTYRHAFGEERPAQELKAELFKTIHPDHIH